MNNLFYSENKIIHLSDEYTKRNIYYKDFLSTQFSTNKNHIDLLLTRVTFIIDYKLSFSQKSAVVIYFNTNLTITEIADILNLNKSTVSRNIKRGLTNIKKHLQAS